MDTGLAKPWGPLETGCTTLHDRFISGANNTHKNEVSAPSNCTNFSFVIGGVSLFSTIDRNFGLRLYHDDEPHELSYC